MPRDILYKDVNNMQGIQQLILFQNVDFVDVHQNWKSSKH